MFTETTQHEPSQKGALGGFRCTCEVCGMRLRSSLETALASEKANHARYHERNLSHLGRGQALSRTGRERLAMARAFLNEEEN